MPAASVTVISGDGHRSYLAEADFPAGVNPRSAVYQAVCSPIHNVLPLSFRRLQRLATSRAGGLIGWAGAAGRGEQATDPMAGGRRPVVPQHADRAGIRRAGRAHPF